jgi:ribosomal protein S18 acetylase RimI-like enzyme
MNDKNNRFDEKVSIREITHSGAIDLLNAGFPYGRSALIKSLSVRFLQATQLAPRETNLIAYHNQKKLAIGFISLVSHTKSIFSIKYVFSDPSFRQMGIASRLLYYALAIAKERGADRIFLNAYPDSVASKLYVKCGFKRIVETYVLRGQGRTFNFAPYSKRRLFSLQTNLKRNKDSIFHIIQSSMGQRWIDFFEISNDTLFNGYSQDYQHFFCKNVFIDSSGESFAMVFISPLRRMAYVELYGWLDNCFHEILEALMKILHKRGVVWINISVFNITGRNCYNILKEKKFHTYQEIFMGKYLKKLL